VPYGTECGSVRRRRRQAGALRRESIGSRGALSGPLHEMVTNAFDPRPSHRRDWHGKSILATAIHGWSSAWQAVCHHLV